MILLTVIDTPGATTPEECADTVPLMVAQLDRATLRAVLGLLAAAFEAHATEADEVAEWEDDGPA
jgi:hypothetical protein